MDARYPAEALRGKFFLPDAAGFFFAVSSHPLFFKEIKPGMIELMKPKLSFAQSEIQDGDVICFQVDLPEKE